MQKIILLPKIIHSRSVNSKKSQQNWLFLAVCRLSGSYDLLKIISFYYFLFLRFQANPPIPAPSEETASPNHPNTLAGSPVFTESLPLVLDLIQCIRNLICKIKIHTHCNKTVALFDHIFQDRKYFLHLFIGNFIL